jgi:hypothetical protein
MTSPLIPDKGPDIVERLRNPEFAGPMRHLQDWYEIDTVMANAASEIVSLRKELEEARERNHLANNRADNAVADAAKARDIALEEAARVVEDTPISLPLGIGMADGASIASRTLAAAIRALKEKS